MWASLSLQRLPTYRHRGIQRMKSMKLYVGNLPSSTSVTDLEDLFTPYGDVISARVLTTQHGGHPRGFGYVESRSINFMVLLVYLRSTALPWFDVSR